MRTPVKRAKAKTSALHVDAEKVAKRAKTAGVAEDQKSADSTVPNKVPHITSEVLAGSARLKQILEAREKAAASAKVA